MADLPFSGEPIQIVRIRQPRCKHVYSKGGCAAASGTVPCFGTRATCKSEESYEAGDPLDLYFGEPGAGLPSDDIHVFPMLKSCKISAPRINVSGADRRVNPFGLLASGTIEFFDGIASDYLVDPYRTERDIKPETKGSFWTKWAVRNFYARAGTEVIVYECFAGRELWRGRKRRVLTNGLALADGAARFDLADPLLGLVEQEVKIPAPSPGVLAEDVTDETSELRILYADRSDYPPPGLVRINDEIIYFGVRSVSDGVIILSGLVRAKWGSTKADHAAEDQVQKCISLSEARVGDGLKKLFDETPLKSASIPLADWRAEAADFLSAYKLTGLLSEPVSARDVIGEILEQVQGFCWFDQHDGQLRFKVVKPLEVDPPLITFEDHINGGKLTVEDFPDRRASRVFYYYKPLDHLNRGKDPSDFSRASAALDVGQESADTFGAPAVRQIFARFIESSAPADEASNRYLTRYRMGVREVKFQIPDLVFEDMALDLGGVITVSHPLLVDKFGNRALDHWIISEARPDHKSRMITITAEEATLAGRIYRVSGNSAPEYVHGAEVPFTRAFVCYNSGLLPGGKPGMKIS